MDSYKTYEAVDSDIELDLSDDFKTKRVKEYMSNYIISDKTVESIRHQFSEELKSGLSETDQYSNTNCLGMKVTFFPELFDGTESGRYVVVFMTERHLLLLLAKVNPGFPVKTEREYFLVDENMRRSPYIKIFEFLCDCMLKFFTKYDLLNQAQSIGFCSDLPIVQFGMNDATVWYFTENASDFPLNCYDIDRCLKIVLLKERFSDLKIELVSVMNVDTSMFVVSSYVFGDIDIYLNLENECNIVYWEDIKKVQRLSSSSGNGYKNILIDTEMLNFGGKGFLDELATDLEWSSEVSLNSDKHISLDKFLCQQNLLEIIKRILVDLHHELLYCRHAGIGTLPDDGISLSELCNLSKNPSLEHIALLLPGGAADASVDDAKILIYVCKIILVRAAVMISVCLESIIGRSSTEDLVISVSCPLLTNHPDFETYIRNAMAKICPRKKFQFLQTDRRIAPTGAALATAIACRLDTKNLNF